MNANAEIAKAIEDLAVAEPRVAEAAGLRILACGAAAVPALLEAATAAAVPARRRVMFLLGELLESPGADVASIRRALVAALAHADWKVRKNAAIALGKTPGDAALDALLERLHDEQDPRVRPSVVLAAGKLAGPSHAARIAAVKPASAEERVALGKVADRLSALGGIVPKIDLDLPVSPGVAVELWCRAGVADLVAEELAERGVAGRVAGPDRVAIVQPTALRDVTLVRSALFAALRVDGAAGHDATALGRALCASSAAAEMKRLTADDRVRYRLRVDVPTDAFRRRREWIAAFAAECPDLVNVATSYTWEIIVRGAARRLAVAARPTAYVDDRFAYRKRDVPASIHPTLAAAALRLVRVADADTVVDPFCGSGTLLAERAVRGPYRRLIGYDIDERALDAARENLASFDGVELRNADILRLRDHGPVDAVVTNPPYGQRVASPRHARRLHAALDDFAAAALRPGGTLVAFRPPDFPNPAKLEVIRRFRVDAGGLAVDVVQAVKPVR
ncbi:MAG: HEAT repeat domain-containing protein [Candidatus Eremiobacteraeota bacterium]|nr:HEAT repeat domain-containing protein [Candidatus Eremiobacteraeota bacterium]